MYEEICDTPGRDAEGKYYSDYFSVAYAKTDQLQRVAVRGTSREGSDDPLSGFYYSFGNHRDSNFPPFPIHTSFPCRFRARRRVASASGINAECETEGNNKQPILTTTLSLIAKIPAAGNCSFQPFRSLSLSLLCHSPGLQNI